MVGRIDRTHRFAWRVVAVLAKHRQEAVVQAAAIGLDIALDSYPEHLPPLENVIPPHHRDVVFGAARHHAGGASRASVQIYDHAPAVFRMRMRRTKLRVFPSFLVSSFHLLREL